MLKTASPGGTTPRQSSPVDTIPPRSDAPQTKFAISFSLCPDQANLLSIINNPFSDEQPRVTGNAAKHLAISYCNGQREAMEEVDWIGGANGVPRFLHKSNFLDVPLRMRVLRV